MKRVLISLMSIMVLVCSGVTNVEAGGRGHGGHGHGHGHGGHHGHHGGHWGHGHANFGFYFGDPFFWGGPRYYRPYAPYYYDPPTTVIVERQPPVYVQRQPAQAAAQVWYYCPNPAGYYPQVPNCSQQWVTVDPSSVPPGPVR